MVQNQGNPMAGTLGRDDATRQLPHPQAHHFGAAKAPSPIGFGSIPHSLANQEAVAQQQRDFKRQRLNEVIPDLARCSVLIGRLYSPIKPSDIYLGVLYITGSWFGGEIACTVVRFNKCDRTHRFFKFPNVSRINLQFSWLRDGCGVAGNEWGVGG